VTILQFRYKGNFVLSVSLSLSLSASVLFSVCPRAIIREPLKTLDIREFFNTSKHSIFGYSRTTITDTIHNPKFTFKTNRNSHHNIEVNSETAAVFKVN